jgi:hypothetical protein
MARRRRSRSSAAALITKAPLGEQAWKLLGHVVTEVAPGKVSEGRGRRKRNTERLAGKIWPPQGWPLCQSQQLCFKAAGYRALG